MGLTDEQMLDIAKQSWEVFRANFKTPYYSLPSFEDMPSNGKTAIVAAIGKSIQLAMASATS